MDLSVAMQNPVNRKLASLLPSNVSRALVRTLVGFYLNRNQAKKAAVTKALQHTVRASRRFNQDLAELWKSVTQGIADHYHEKLMMGFKPISWLDGMLDKRTQYYNWDWMELARAEGKGIVVVTGHFGAVEYLPLLLARRGLPITTMVHCKTAALKSALTAKAEGFGAKLLDPKTQPVFISALKHLKENRVLVTQCDEMDSWRPHKTKTISFLGLNLPLDRSLDLLLTKSGAVPLFCLVNRKPKGRFQVEIVPLDNPDAAQMTYGEQCLTMLSKRIMANPRAWYEWAKLAEHITPVCPRCMKG